jgi:hypothetical protein
MKVYPLPKTWDVAKFITRYGLDRDTDLYINTDGKLVVLLPLADDPPIFELPDPPKKAATLDDLIKRIETLEGKVK